MAIILELSVRSVAILVCWALMAVATFCFCATVSLFHSLILLAVARGENIS